MGSGLNRVEGRDNVNDKIFDFFSDMLGSNPPSIAKCNPKISDGNDQTIQEGLMLNQINHTNIVFVPKNPSPNDPGDLRPIACCNVVHMIISKLICSRVRVVLPHLVNQNQTAFIPGRLMVHNTMLCQELTRGYTRKGGTPRCIMSIDLKKAYDSIVHDFVEEILIGLKFPQVAVNWIMKCITSVTYSTCFNGSVFGFFKGKKANKDSINTLMIGFKNFAVVSGMAINHQKSQIILAGVNDETKQELTNITSFSSGTLLLRYLGIPITASRIHVSDCKVLVDKITAKLRTWGSKHMSYAGRVTIINNVLIGIYGFWTGAFVLHKSVIKEVEKLCRQFLWGSDGNQIKQALMAWDLVCKPKNIGGLGIKHFENWNNALMCKHIWDIAHKTDSLWVKWVHTHYLKHSDWWEWKPPSDVCWYLKKLHNISCKAWITDIRRSNLEKYNAKAIYKIISGVSPKVDWAANVWCKTIQPKHAHKLWLAYHGRLQVAERIATFNPSISPICNLCSKAVETQEHAIFQCEIVAMVHDHIQSWCHKMYPMQDLIVLMDWLASRRMKQVNKIWFKAIIAAVIYNVWCQRNRVLFEKEQFSQHTVIRFIKNSVNDRPKYIVQRNIKFKDWNRDFN